MAFRGLADKSSVSADLFRLFSFFDPERIPLSLLTEGSQGVPESMELGKMIKSPFKLSNALADMRSGSLAHRLGYGEEKAVVAVHGPRARAHGPGWAGFFLQAHAVGPMGPRYKRMWLASRPNIV